MKLQGISEQGMKRIASKVKGQAEEQFLLQDTSGRYWTGSTWGVAEAAETFPRSELEMLDLDDKVNPENFFDNDTYDIGWGDEHGNIFVIAYPSEGKRTSRRAEEDTGQDYLQTVKAIAEGIVARKRAGFMEEDIEYGDWYNIDGSAGMFAIPADLVGDVDLEEEERKGFPSFQDYHEGNEIYEVEKVTGFGARMSAPGYMDATDWTVFDTQEEAEEYLKEQYGDEDF